MKLLGLRPMMYTSDLNGTIDFYVNILGFNLNAHSEEWGWASLSKDSAWLMLSRPNEHEHFEKSTFTGSFYFNTDDVDAIWTLIKDKVKVCYEPEEFEWGMREFGIYDNNGYMLQFGQQIDETK